MWLLSVILSTLFVSFGHGEVFDITVVELSSTITPQIGTRIIGGQPTSIERYPFTVQVLYNSQLVCGGSLITRRHVLSAGHCFVNTRGAVVAANLFAIRVGTAQLNSGGTRHSVSTIVVHEQYNRPLRDNDVAVLVLSSTVTLNNRVDIAPLPNQNSLVPDNTPVIHVGWGRTNMNVDQAASVLNEVTVYTINLAICSARYNQLAQIYQQAYPVTNNMICAGLLDIGGKDACQGDSGGPLVYTYNVNVVVGITSWGYGCAHPTYPGVSARVASYTNWINDTVRRYNSSPPLRNLNYVMILTALFAAILNIVTC